jgi:hypothetical protein
MYGWTTTPANCAAWESSLKFSSRLDVSFHISNHYRSYDDDCY